MSEVIVGKWGKNLAIRVPHDIVRAAGLSDGEHVEIEEVDGDIRIRRTRANVLRRQNALDAASEIITESRKHSLAGISIRELQVDGRRE